MLTCIYYVSLNFLGRLARQKHPRRCTQCVETVVNIEAFVPMQHILCQ